MELLENTNEAQSPAISGDAAQFTKKRPKKRKFIIAAIVLVLLIYVVKSCFFPTQVLLAVTVEPLARMDLTDSISLSGQIESANTHRVYAPFTAEPLTVDVEVGDTVAAGQTLATMDTTDCRSPRS